MHIVALEFMESTFVTSGHVHYHCCYYTLYAPSSFTISAGFPCDTD